MNIESTECLLGATEAAALTGTNKKIIWRAVAIFSLAGLCAGFAAGQTGDPPIVSRHVFNRVPLGQAPSSVASISSTDVQAASSTLVAVGGGKITYTCDPSIEATMPGTCNYLNTTIANIYASTFSNANANIYITFGITGLGQSDQHLTGPLYTAYRSALISHSSGDPVDAAALASLPASLTSPFSGTQVILTAALAQALGFTGPGTTASGTSCTLGNTGCYNGVITVTTPANLSSETGNSQFLYFRQNGGTQPSNAYDFYSIVEHETDEILGTSSCISTSGSLSDYCGTGTPSAVDLFRYSAPGTRVLISTTPGAYFSYDGGNTNVAVYNTLANGEDYADWATNCQHVQDAQGCLGRSFDITNDGGVEIAVLDAVGFNRTTAAAATYLGSDSITQGTWTGAYGGDGYVIANGASAPPSYASVSVTSGLSYTWASSTGDTRALQTASGASTRIASTYYSFGSFNINLNLTDGDAHRIGLYLVDWDSSTRAETVTVLNASTNAILSTQSFSNFHNGVWASWNVTGNVIIQVTLTGGSNAVAAGVFFDPAPSSSATAKYVGMDTTTQGTWTGVHGADGNIIATEPAAPPSYATVSVNGASQYAWGVSTSPRALQIASGSSGRIASTYYAGSFTINVNLTDGNTHRIGLYLLDWDSNARAETITVVDANSHVVLDAENYSNFNGGVYALWDVKGSVTIEVTDTGGANAVVAGLFFDPTAAVATASYVGTDTSTQGTWTGKYGSTGQLIANGLTNPPSFGTTSFVGDSLYTWSGATTDPRALQVSSGATSGIASTYYGGSFSINVNLTDGNTHKVSLYLLDWDSTLRAETIAVLDAASHVTLNSQSYSSFNSGQWAVWNLKGNVIIQVTDTNGANAVVSGVFFD